MTGLKTAIRILIAALREIFDEAAYSRFLHRCHMDSCPASYAEFWRERETTQSRKPRCC